MARNVSAQMLDIYVFSKPYFDREGLIVAEQDGEVVGYVHAGFGPDESRRTISYDAGVTCMLMVAPQVIFADLAPQLLTRSEAYLRRKGAQLVYAGGMFPLNPFYLGLYGGSELPGFLSSDVQRSQFFPAHGYEQVDQAVVLQRSLDDFCRPVDRRLMRLRREYQISLDATAPPVDWWDACVYPPGNPTRFDLIPRHGTDVRASVRFWVIEPLSNTWEKLTVGLTHLQVASSCRREGLATLLNYEALKQLRQNGVGIVEAQTMVHNSAAVGLYHKLGFQTVDQGTVFRKVA